MRRRREPVAPKHAPACEQGQPCLASAAAASGGSRLVISAVQRGIAALFAVLALSACAGSSLTASQDAELRSVFTQMRLGRIARAEAAFDPRFSRPELGKTLAGLARVIPRQPPQSVRLLASSSVETSLGQAYLATYEYGYPDRFLIVRTGIFRPAAAAPMVNTFYIDVAPMHVVRANALTLEGKSARQYGFLALAVASPLMIVIALISLARSLRVRGKALWMIGMVIGLGALTMNWTTGAVGVRPLFIDPFGVWVMHADTPAAPWMITASLPLVALIYLLLRLLGWPRVTRTLPTGLTLADSD